MIAVQHFTVTHWCYQKQDKKDGKINLYKWVLSRRKWNIVGLLSLKNTGQDHRCGKSFK